LDNEIKAVSFDYSVYAGYCDVLVICENNKAYRALYKDGGKFAHSSPNISTGSNYLGMGVKNIKKGRPPPFHVRCFG
jgi:hypothetical protein